MTESGLKASRNIFDRATGIEAARKARREMTRFAIEPIGQMLNISIPSMTLMSLLTRAQAFHDGAIEALESNNPFATFSLIRSHAENAAALLWIVERPADIGTFYP